MVYKPVLNFILGAQQSVPLARQTTPQIGTNIVPQEKVYPPTLYKAKASGYKEQLVYMRNREEAFSSLKLPN